MAKSRRAYAFALPDDYHYDAIDDCPTCPMFQCNYSGEYCGLMLRDVDTRDGVEFPRPAWCPLVEVAVR